MAGRQVYIYSKTELQPHEIDAVEYCKRYGEHMLAVRIVSFRKGQAERTDFIAQLEELVKENEDILISISPR